MIIGREHETYVFELIVLPTSPTLEKLVSDDDFVFSDLKSDSRDLKYLQQAKYFNKKHEINMNDDNIGYSEATNVISTNFRKILFSGCTCSG